MAKKKHSAPKSNPASNVAISSSPVKVSPFLASLMVGAGVMEKPETPEELKVDGAFLDELRLALPAEKAARFGPWLERFASFCKELDKKNIALADGAAGLQSQAITQAAAFEQERQSLLDIAENDREALKQDEEELYKQRDLLFTDRQQLDEQKQALMPRLESAAAKESELADRELALLTRELDARSGFASIKQQTLEALKSEVRQLESERDRLHQDVANQKESFTKRQQEQDMALEQRDRDLNVKAQAYEKIRLRLQRQQDDLDQEKSQLQAAIDEGMEGERNQHLRDLERKDKSLERLHQQMDVLKNHLAGFQELMAVLGDKDPQALLDELQELRRANSAFRASGSAADTQRLDQENAGLREQLAASESRLRDLVPELEQSKIELSRKRMGAAELETLAAEKRALEKHKQLLSVHLGDLSARIDLLTDASKAQSAFPQLSAMDSRDDCRITKVLEPVPNDLEAFANELQQRIAQAEPGTRLYYPIDDIRTLLGGMAMSQLHVFQGISGTGKTSLAKAFAKAMGGFCTDIAVQAGWRDSDDLLGHYNAFEKRFYEKDCLQALYQA